MGADVDTLLPMRSSSSSMNPQCSSRQPLAITELGQCKQPLDWLLGGSGPHLHILDPLPVMKRLHMWKGKSELQCLTLLSMQQPRPDHSTGALTFMNWTTMSVLTAL